MERLKEIVEPKGTGIPGLTAKLVERTKNKAIYLRSDDVYEVFKIKIAPAGMSQREQFYPEREIYPNNEDFGKTAWTYRTLDKAKRKYDKI